MIDFKTLETYSRLMAPTASERLIRLVKKQPGSLGISLKAAGGIPMDEAVRTDILTCLFDVNDSEVGWGLTFCQGLLSEGKCDDEIENTLIQRLPEFLKSNAPEIRSEAVNLLIMLRKRFPTYRHWMLPSLQDPCPTIRRQALMNSQTFLEPGEIEPLVAFRDDNYLTEISIGSHLIYSLRNEALDRIEQAIGKTFERKQLSEVVEGGEKAYWWDWKPFLGWWEKRQSKWRIWKRE